MNVLVAQVYILVWRFSSLARYVYARYVYTRWTTIRTLCGDVTWIKRLDSCKPHLYPSLGNICMHVLHAFYMTSPVQYMATFERMSQ